VNDIMGLPAHPLFAHIPVVLIPLAALGVVLMCWPKLRDRIGWFVAGILVIAGIATQLAISAGKNLRQYVPETQLVRTHAHMGENIRPWLLLMFLCVLGVLLVDRAMAKRAAAATAPSVTASTVTASTVTASTVTASTVTSSTGGTSASGEQRRDGLKIASAALLALALVFSALSVYWIVKIGHSGSKAVWQTTQTRIDKGQRIGEHGERGGEGGG
jgi:hypothetical protein